MSKMCLHKHKEVEAIQKHHFILELFVSAEDDGTGIVALQVRIDSDRKLSQ